MKINKYLGALILASLIAPVVKAQFTGKPQYNIATRRAGVPLGNIKVELFPLIAPRHVKNFDSLVNTQFYDSTAFHRVIPGFMIQGGDPNSRHGVRGTWGNGSPSQPTVPAEFNAVSHIRGVLSAARDTGKNSANSQFFICVGNPTYLDGQYCAYGHAISGMNYVDTIVNASRDASDNPYQKIDMFVTYVGSNDSTPNATTLISPVNGLINAPSSIILKWGSVKTAEVYHLELSHDSAFSTIYFSKNIYNPTYRITALPSSNKFFWRVFVNNGGRFSASSEVRNFSTVAYYAIHEVSSTGFKLNQNIPNPAYNEMFMEYAIPEPAQVSIKLYNMLGKEILEIMNEFKSAGEHKQMVNLQKLSSGIYFYKLQAGNKTLVRRMVKIDSE